MPILHTINRDLKLVMSSWVGDISDSDLLPSYRKLYDDASWQPGFSEIVDLRDAELSSVTSEALRRLASMVDGYTRGKCEQFKTAVIAPSNLPFGIARMYEVYADTSPEDVKVFRDLKPAFEWIGISEYLTGSSINPNTTES